MASLLDRIKSAVSSVAKSFTNSSSSSSRSSSSSSKNASSGSSSAKTNSSNTPYVYQINSDKGKNIASNMGIGSTYNASDGSTWKKNTDGSISVTTKNGSTYSSNYAPNSSSNASSKTSITSTPKTTSNNKSSNKSTTSAKYVDVSSKTGTGTGKAPAGLSVGTVVHTDAGNYTITGIKADGSYTSKPSSELRSSGGFTGNNSNTKPSIVDVSSKSGTGTGKAPKGLSVGTTVRTDAGDYVITGVKPDGSYDSKLVTGTASRGVTSVAPSNTKPSTSSGSGSSTNSTKQTTEKTSADSVKNSTLENKTITSKQSYNGDYITFNLNDDYKALMDEAAAKGDYATAAKYEAMRNAKIDYLNQQNGTNYSGTTNYLNVYKAKNNQGGTIYEDNGSLADLKVGINNVNGAVYRKDNDGRIYQAVGKFANGETNWAFVGDGFNKATGEFTFSNIEDAKRSYMDSLYSYGADKDQKYIYQDPSKMYDSDVVADAWNYYNQIGIADPVYVENLAAGTTGAYTQNIIEEARIELERKKAEEEAREAAILAMMMREQEQIDSQQQIVQPTQPIVQPMQPVQPIQPVQQTTQQNQQIIPTEPTAPIVNNTYISSDLGINKGQPTDGVTTVQTNEKTTLPPTVNENSFEAENIDWESYYRRRVPLRGQIR